MSTTRNVPLTWTETPWVRRTPLAWLSDLLTGRRPHRGATYTAVGSNGDTYTLTPEATAPQYRLDIDRHSPDGTRPAPSEPTRASSQASNLSCAMQVAALDATGERPLIGTHRWRESRVEYRQLLSPSGGHRGANDWQTVQTTDDPAQAQAWRQDARGHQHLRVVEVRTEEMFTRLH